MDRKPEFYIVEGAFVARSTVTPTEHRLERWAWDKDAWVPYPNYSDVMFNGRVVDEAAAQKFIQENGPKARPKEERDG